MEGRIGSEDESSAQSRRSTGLAGTAASEGGSESTRGIDGDWDVVGECGDGCMDEKGSDSGSGGSV